MPKILTKLRIDEVSAVDKGANEGARILLFKADATRRDVASLKHTLLRFGRRCWTTHQEVLNPAFWIGTGK